MARSGTSKIVGRESVTTRAGTFDAFNIQMSYSDRNVNDPTRKYDVVIQTTVCPGGRSLGQAYLHFAMDGQPRENNTVELVEFGRK